MQELKLYVSVDENGHILWQHFHMGAGKYVPVVDCSQNNPDAQFPCLVYSNKASVNPLYVVHRVAKGGSNYIAFKTAYAAILAAQVSNGYESDIIPIGCIGAVNGAKLPPGVAVESLNSKVVVTATKDWSRRGRVLSVSAKLDGVEVGRVNVYKAGGAAGLPVIHYCSGLHVEPSCRRQGVATAMYDYIENLLGVKLKPEFQQSDDGAAFWRSRVGNKVEHLVAEALSHNA